MFTLVNQTVEAAKRGASTKAQANFLNACLRRFLRERDTLVAGTDSDPVAFWNHPAWWIKRVQHEHPQLWREVLQAANCHAPMTLRVNVRKDQSDRLSVDLAASRHSSPSDRGWRHCAGACRCVQHLPGFEQGMVSVQDAAAQMAAPMLLQGLTQQRELRILDACAAPGGKTGHLLELSEGEVTSPGN